VVGLEAGWRFFLGSGHDLRGFFLGPQIGVGIQNDTYTDVNGRTGTTASGTFYRAGLEFGHQWILGPGFVITPALTADFIPSYAVGAGRPAADGRIFGGIELNLGWAIPR
jgi:outer membrane autotransporter protein